MNVTIRITTQSGADVEISQDRPEINTYGSAKDFDARLIAETLDAVVERVRSSYGITATTTPAAPDDTTERHV